MGSRFRRFRLISFIAVIALLSFVASFLWHGIGKNLFMDSFSDQYVLDSLADDHELSMAVPIVIKRRDHIIPALLDRLSHDPSEVVRAKAAFCCGVIGFRGREDTIYQLVLQREVVPALKAALKDTSMLVRVKSAQALWRIEGKKEDILPTLATGWRSGGQKEMYVVYQTVEDMGADASDLGGVLLPSLDDPDELIRRWASNALKAIKPANETQPKK